MKTGKVLLFVAIGLFIAIGLFGQGKEKITITNPFRTDARAVIVEVNPLPKFTFAPDKTFRIRKTDKAVMYEYKPKKPDKAYQHLTIFLELLQKETKTKPPKIDVMIVTQGEFLNLVEVSGLVWTEPLAETSAKPGGSRLLRFVEEDTFKIFMVNFKDPARVLLLEQFLTHQALLTEWELSVRNVSPEDTEVLLDKRNEEWKKREGKAYALFNKIAGNWKLLKLDWPPTPPQRPRVLSVPLPWPWPRSSPPPR